MSLKEEAEKLKTEIANAGKEIVALQELQKTHNISLENVYAKCSHQWEIKYTPEHQKGYVSPGDAPGTMGIDWRGPFSVPSKTIDRWTRECKCCGKIETTKKVRVKETETYEPDFEKPPLK